MSKSLEQSKRVSNVRGFLGYRYQTMDSQDYREQRRRSDILNKEGYIAFPLTAPIKEQNRLKKLLK